MTATAERGKSDAQGLAEELRTHIHEAIDLLAVEREGFSTPKTADKLLEMLDVLTQIDDMLQEIADDYDRGAVKAAE
jgi:hypothetical protein